MKTILKIFIISFIAFGFFISGCFTKSYAADNLNLPTETIPGKFMSVTDGLITIKQKGIEKSYIRVEDPFNIYADYITYRTSPFSKAVQSSLCKVVFLDTFVIKIKLPNSSNIEIPRYRVVNLEINIK